MNGYRSLDVKLTKAYQMKNKKWLNIYKFPCIINFCIFDNIIIQNNPFDSICTKNNNLLRTTKETSHLKYV